MSRTVTGLFDTHEDAEAAVRDLEGAGIPHSEVSIVASDADGRYATTRRGAHMSDDAGAGAGIGAALGGAGGLLAGLGFIAIPGVGPVIAAGWLASALVGAAAGAAVGGAAGGIVGALTEAGVPEDEAQIYAEGVRRGGALVTTRVDEALAGAAQRILQRSRSVDALARGEAYRSAGWTGFDPAAPPYTAEEVAIERERYRGADLTAEPRSFGVDAGLGAPADIADDEEPFQRGDEVLPGPPPFGR